MTVRSEARQKNRSVPASGRRRRATRGQVARPPVTRMRAARDSDAASRGEQSPTAVAAEALRTGVLPPCGRRQREAIPNENETICVGDPDDSCMANEYVGDETPGGSSSTPDQSGVDEIGRVYGLQEEDSGTLRCSSEVLARRDRHRTELCPPRRKV